MNEQLFDAMLRTALEEDAARTVLDSGQIQALMARLKKEKIFSDRSFQREIPGHSLKKSGKKFEKHLW